MKTADLPDDVKVYFDEFVNLMLVERAKQLGVPVVDVKGDVLPKEFSVGWIKNVFETISSVVNFARDHTDDAEAALVKVATVASVAYEKIKKLEKSLPKG